MKTWLTIITIVLVLGITWGLCVYGPEFAVDTINWFNNLFPRPVL